MDLDEESVADTDGELSPDGLDGVHDFLLMAHQVDPQLHQLAQAQPGNLHKHIINLI
jgi:hypothetical protein